MKLNSIIVLSVTIFIFLSCNNNPESQEFFSKGREVKSGFIWEKQQVKPEKILKNRTITLLFEENFNNLNPKMWSIQGGNWDVKNGKAFSTKGLNRNMVLNGVELPKNAVVEMDIVSQTDFVDAKFNLYGDGKIHDHGDGYSFIMGGWKGKISVISKLHEHEKNRIEERSTRWEANKLYRVKVIKIDSRIYWYINDKLFLARMDKNVLKPTEGFKYLSLANWKSNLSFDNIRIYKIGKKDVHSN